MKNIQISIPKPCHENWNEMTPKEQGRFCSSCQKTVVDFSVMSDRQIVEFFQKPAGATCGRFHTDQLGREIAIPKKSIPWAQYLFKATWPAFVLFLKSCTDRQSTVGKIAIEAPQPHDGELRYSTLGSVLSKITPLDSTKEIKKAPEKIEIVLTHTVGLIEPPPQHITGDTIINVNEPVEEILPIKESCQPMDTVTIAGYPAYQTGKVVTGGISVNTTKTISEEVVSKEVEKNDLTIRAYPNPVRAGGQLTVSFTSTEIIGQMQLISASGASFPLARNVIPESGLVTVSIPGSLSAGAYYLQVAVNNKHTKTVKLILLN